MRGIDEMTQHSPLEQLESRPRSTEAFTLEGGPRSTEAFTMVEVLIVIAITVVLFGLLIRPLIDTLRYSKDAQLQTAAQDSGRKVMAMLSRELGGAAGVFDGSSMPVEQTSVATGIQNIQYTNFLDVDVPQFDANGNVKAQGAVAHLYNAKFDFTMARHQTTGLVDPTVDKAGPTTGATSGSIDLKPGPGGGVVTTTDVLLPAAPGTTMIRYFVGLKNPEQNFPNLPYNNPDDHLFGTGPTNPYVLYRAQFSPVVNAAGTNSPVNAELFDVDYRTKASGSDHSKEKPFLDDPDFFRLVSTGDVNWNTAVHSNYSATDADAHNVRVKNWEQIAKPIVNAPETDLLVLPHNPDRTIAYDDPAAAAAPTVFPGIAHFDTDNDPATGKTSPVVHSSVQFRPGLVESDAAPSTNSDYASAGVPSTNVDQIGLSYAPSQYATSGQNWTQPYTVLLYPLFAASGATPSIDTARYYGVTQAGTSYTQTVGTATVNVTAGDLVETQVSGATSTPVYDVTTAMPLVTTGTYCPVSVNSDSGIVDFDTPGIPDPIGHPFAKFWYYQPTGSATTTYTVDLTQPMNAPSTAGFTANLPSPLKTVANARIVPGSMQVYGPDETQGPSLWSYANPSSNWDATYPAIPAGWVPYTPAGVGADLGVNQYNIDYSAQTITLSKDYPSQSGNTLPLLIAYNYQANVSGIDPTQPISSTNPGNPFVVKVEYHSKDLISIQLGLRYFNAEGNAQTVSTSNDLQVGNGNR